MKNNKQRIIPATMASQHPDHASKPYWHNKTFIDVHAESKECYLMFSELGIDEYKWDWEGKLVDESVMERLFGQHFDYFKENQIGLKKFITFRLPNPKVETEFRLGRAFLGILSAASMAEKLSLHAPPLFEVILPMTESAIEMIAIQEAFKELSGLKHKLYKLGQHSLSHLEVIPLFEQVETIIDSDKILEEYISEHEKKFGATPQSIRPYLARSDPALNSGLVPTVLAIKIALSKYKKLANRLHIPLYPIIGSASLPFRGGLTPESVEAFVQEYKGIRTVLLQGGFRYDYPTVKVKNAIKKLQELIPKTLAVDVPREDEEKMRKLIPFFETNYQETIEQIAPLINQLASYMPPRRERVQHTGLFGYSRGVGKVKLPRAIGFTASLYSLGIPPELIGTGRGLRIAASLQDQAIIEKYYILLKSDLERASRFFNRNVLISLTHDSPAWGTILDDVDAIEKYLHISMQPKTSEEKEHQKLTSKIYSRLVNGGELQEVIVEAGKLRKSLG